MRETTRTLRYPPGTLIGEYLRTAFGVVVGTSVLAVNPVGWALGPSVGRITLLFAGFGTRTAIRQITRVDVDADGLTHRAVVTRPLAWDALSSLRLRYYGSKRERKAEGGFYQLKLRAPGVRLNFESGLTGFDYLVSRAGTAARENVLPLDPATIANMPAFGINADGDLAPPPGIATFAGTIEKLSLSRKPEPERGDRPRNGQQTHERAWAGGRR